MDLSKSTLFNTRENIRNSLKLITDKQLKIVDLGSSATMHFAEGEDWQKNLDEVKRFIDLADQLQCPYIRVFPNNFPKEQDRDKTLELIAKGLLESGDHARSANVTVLMETHGDVVQIPDILKIMHLAEHPHVGLVWDPVNMWFKTKESPAKMYAALKKYIRHTHIKDLNIIDGKAQYTLLGKGQAPIFEAIDALHNGGYKGYYSFEWEKLWHPEIAEPEIALADYIKAMQMHFAQ